MSLDYTANIFLNLHKMRIGHEVHVSKSGRVKCRNPVVYADHVPVKKTNSQNVWPRINSN